MRRTAPAAATTGATDDSVRQRIVDATLTVIATDGLDAVRHRRVADLAGVSLGSTSYHFASRDELVEAAFLHYLELATEFLDQLAVPTARASSAAAALIGSIERLIDTEFAERGLVQAEYELILFATRTGRVAAHLQQWEEVRHDQLASLLRSAGARHPDDDARTLFALVRGLELERLTRGAPIPHLRRRLEPVVRAMLER
jgi:DNA-binding transcriptional regulator YbjK